MYLSHPPKFLQRIYKSLTWRLNPENKTIYLTFDDGPTKGVTDQVLDMLKNYNAKATFFCLGKNVEWNKELYERILREGHQIGNHTYNHLNGWKTNNSEYLRDVHRADLVLNTKLFRPPYGKINSKQIQRLRKNYRIIMWTVLTRDYNPRLTKEACLKLTLKKVDNGSIFVFHDSLKAKERMLYALEGLLDYAEKHQFRFGLV